MAARLSHNLHPLTIADGLIVDGITNEHVILRGVNRSGLEYSPPIGNGSLANAGITEAEIEHIVTDWHARIIRLPFNQAWALARDGYDPEPYLEAIDSVIQITARNGAYTLLDLQWLDADTIRGFDQHGNPNRVPPLPNLDSIRLWGQLARRYFQEPAVLYDIFNEPHPVLKGDPIPLLGIRDDGATFSLPSGNVGMKEWQPWARQLINAIRFVNNDALIFVSGVDWAFDLSGFPLRDEARVVYSTHVYRDKGNYRDARFGSLASDGVAVFAGEWGGGDEETSWGEGLADYFDEIGIGWTAWSWKDQPFLVQPPPAPPYPPTSFGTLIRQRLRAELRNAEPVRASRE